MSTGVDEVGHFRATRGLFCPRLLRQQWRKWISRKNFWGGPSVV